MSLSVKSIASWGYKYTVNHQSQIQTQSKSGKNNWDREEEGRRDLRQQPPNSQ